MALKIRRGLEANRLSITPAEGELIYVTDTKKLYIGDGSTAGGVLVTFVSGDETDPVFTAWDKDYADLINTPTLVTTISGLTDVNLTGLADGDVLVYDDTSGDWLPETPASGSSLTVEEQDGTPTVADVVKIKVTNGTLTNDGSGVVSIDFGSAATDGSAIHDNEANEISAITEKTSINKADLYIVEDSEASYVKKKVKAEYVVPDIGCRVYNNASITVPNNGANLTFNSERYDTDEIHDISSNTGRLTCKTAGKYLIIGNIEWASNSYGFRDVRILLNGTTIIGIVREAAYNTGCIQFVSTIYNLNVNDYVELHAYQDSGGNLNVIVSGNFTPEFMMQKIG